VIIRRKTTMKIDLVGTTALFAQKGALQSHKINALDTQKSRNALRIGEVGLVAPVIENDGNF
jgi:hypothetical protein